MNDTVNESVVSNDTPAANTVTVNYHFKRMDHTATNLAKLVKGYAVVPATETKVAGELLSDINYEVENTYVVDAQGVATEVVIKSTIKRDSEEYDLVVPTVEELGLLLPVVLSEGSDNGAGGVVTDDQIAVSKTAYEFSLKQAKFLLQIVEDSIYKVGRPLVDKGEKLTADNCNWMLAVELGLATKASTAKAAKGIGKELLAAAVESFKEYLVAIGKPTAGIEVMCKMVKSRFSANVINKYMKGLPMVKDNLINWVTDGCTPEEQEVFTPVALDMTTRIEDALKPKEEVGDLF